MVAFVVNAQQIEMKQEQVAVKIRDLTLVLLRALVAPVGVVTCLVKQEWDVVRRLAFYVNRVHRERRGSNQDVATQ